MIEGRVGPGDYEYARVKEAGCAIGEAIDGLCLHFILMLEISLEWHDTTKSRVLRFTTS